MLSCSCNLHETKGYEWDLPTVELKNEQNVFAPLPTAEFKGKYTGMKVLFIPHLCQVPYF